MFIRKIYCYIASVILQQRHINKNESFLLPTLDMQSTSNDHRLYTHLHIISSVRKPSLFEMMLTKTKSTGWSVTNAAVFPVVGLELSNLSEDVC